MTYSMWVRPLLSEEETHFRKCRLGTRAAGRDRLAIMAPESHPCVAFIQTEGERHWVELGGGQGFWDGLPPVRATGGRKIAVLYGADSPLQYLTNLARELGIFYLQEPGSPSYRNPMYFECRYAEAFGNAFTHADRALAWWDKHRSPLSRWFGASYPDPNGKKVQEIKEAMRGLLANAQSL